MSVTSSEAENGDAAVEKAEGTFVGKSISKLILHECTGTIVAKNSVTVRSGFTVESGSIAFWNKYYTCYTETFAVGAFSNNNIGDNYVGDILKTTTNVFANTFTNNKVAGSSVKNNKNWGCDAGSPTVSSH